MTDRVQACPGGTMVARRKLRTVLDGQKLVSRSSSVRTSLGCFRKFRKVSLGLGKSDQGFQDCD